MYSILLRPLIVEDAETSYKWRNDQEIWEYTGSRPDKEITIEIEKDWIDLVFKQENSYRFAILADKKYIGNIQITNITPKQEGEYHIFIGEKSYWGKGIATIATLQLIRFIKNHLSLKELYLFVNSENKSAIRVYEKCGFVSVSNEIKMVIDLTQNYQPKVSVFMMTYNHEKYIKQAIESIISQKTNFDFDVVIGEDYSTDNTREIIQGIARDFPGKFRLLLHDKNIGAMANQMAILSACTGKYIAICEGDDYWTDPYKLQKQVAFLEANIDFAICGSKAKTKYEYEENHPREYIGIDEGEYTIEDLIQDNFLPTASVLIRKKFLDAALNEYSQFLNYDWSLFLMCAFYGKIKNFGEPMVVHRLHTGGVWESKSTKEKLLHTVDLLYNFETYFPESLKSNLQIHKRRLFADLARIALNNSDWTSIIDNTIKANSDQTDEFSQLVTSFVDTLQSKNLEIEQLKGVISQYKNSKSFKLGNRIVKVLNKIRP